MLQSLFKSTGLCSRTCLCRYHPTAQLYRGYIIVINPLGDFGLYPKGSGYDNHLESLTKIPSSHLYEKKDGAFELTSLPPHPHVLLAFK